MHLNKSSKTVQWKMSSEDYSKALERRFHAIETERLGSELPFKYFGLQCDRKTVPQCHEYVRSNQSYEHLVLKAEGWSIGFNVGDKDICPACLAPLQPLPEAI